ncbi:MAG TPA: hypothetical protein VFJ74_13815 [Gemmatimonadaceae bacterium]|nr:hypothetical protein [Gemmatimonadaceae bacterium]
MHAIADPRLGARNGAGAARAVATLRARGELWESAPGVIGLRGDALVLFRALERAVARVCGGGRGAWHADEWMVPPALSFETLERARYFASFPQWLTAASHLDGDAASLERVAASDRPADAARAALAPATAALPPAVCYHAYAALAGRTLHAPALVTAQCTCWRHEGERLRPLARGWAFTMRETVCLGGDDVVRRFADRGAAGAVALAGALGLRARVAEAEDPFFAPTARGRAALQRVKALKHELLLPIGDGEEIAAASVNRHERFFGECFDIRQSDGAPAAGACVAFGVERWTLAVLAAHGPDARDWPDVDAAHPEEES